MRITYILSLIFSAFITQTIFSASLAVYNNTKKPLFVTAQWGSQATRDTITIKPNQSNSFSYGSFFHKFSNITWRSEGEGINYTLDTPSNRTLSGTISIYPKGIYIINFNKKGTYPYNWVELGRSPKRSEVPNMTYPQAIEHIKKITPE